jgi:hypothetical protein
LLVFGFAVGVVSFFAHASEAAGEEGYAGTAGATEGGEGR